jgi:hypothetical protein
MRRGSGSDTSIEDRTQERADTFERHDGEWLWARWVTILPSEVPGL